MAGASKQVERRLFVQAHKCNCEIRSFNGAKCIWIVEKTEIQEIDYIGGVVEGDTYDGSGKLKVFKGEIVAVTNLEVYSSCRNCIAKVVEWGEAMVACGKCDSKIKALKCAKKVLHMLL